MNKVWAGTAFLLVTCAVSLLAPGAASPASPATTNVPASGASPASPVSTNEPVSGAISPVRTNEPSIQTPKPREVVDSPKPSVAVDTPKPSAAAAEAAVLPLSHPAVNAVRPSQPSPVKETSELERRIGEWIAALAQEKGFEAWIGCRWDTMPLGPGTRSWLVTLYKGTEEVGYLVVGSTAEGSYALAEYGTGNHPLFSWRTLHLILVRHGLIPEHTSFDVFAKDRKIHLARVYRQGLEAYWKVRIGSDTYYFDAKAGDWLPDLAKLPPLRDKVPFIPAPANEAPAVNTTAFYPTFDPFERARWVKNKAVEIEGADDLKILLDRQDAVTYTARVYQKQALYPFAVTGYQRWANGDVYVGLDHDGGRFLPLPAIIAAGRFYP